MRREARVDPFVLFLSVEEALLEEILVRGRTGSRWNIGRLLVLLTGLPFLLLSICSRLLLLLL